MTSGLKFWTDTIQKAINLILTGNKMWLSHYCRTKTLINRMWHTALPDKVKAKKTISTCKVLATIFWDGHGVLLIKFKEQQYVQPLILPPSINFYVRYRIRSRSVIRGFLLHDQPHSHSHQKSYQIFRIGTGWPPSVQLHLAPSDIHWFCYLKDILGSKYFATGAKVKAAVEDSFASQTAHFLWLRNTNACLRKLNKSLNKNGSYVEKYKKRTEFNKSLILK